MRILLVAMLLVACATAAEKREREREHIRRTTGAIVGLVLDRDSGDTITKAEIRVRGAGVTKTVVSDVEGMYDIDQLAPGRYDVLATFAGQPIEVSHVDVTAGEATAVDLVFTLGRPDPIKIDWQNLAAVAIRRYHPKRLTAQVSRIEGTVSDVQTKQRVAGAVVTAVGGDAAQTQQTISDDRGRFKFDAVAPGIYAVSAYYNVSGRGQIEVLRSGIEVAGAEAVVVPLWIELAR